MSVSGWETRSTTSAVSMDDRRARAQGPAFASQQFAPARSRHQPAPQGHDVPSRHQSFPAPPPPHAHNGHHGQYAGVEAPARRQSQVPSSRPSPQQQQRYDPRLQQSNGYREQASPPPYYDQRDMNQPQRFAPPPSSPQHQRQQQAPPAPPSNGHYSPQRDDYYRQPPNGPDRAYQDNQQQHRQDPEEQYYDSLPPPLPVRRGVGPAAPTVPIEMPDHAVRATASPSTASSSDDEPANINDVLLGRRWSIHVISHLYQFQRQELSDYAHELVKFLRGHAVMTYGQEFGYSVMIRFTSECVAFQVVEARDLHAEFLIEKAEQPQRSASQRPELEKQESTETNADVRQRTGSFIVYFPKTAEDGARLGPLAANRHGRAAPTENNEKGESKYVFLLRGNEELMAWVCSWVQRRFQCVVGLHVVRVTEENLRRVARNWVIEALEREERVEKARQRKAERLRKISAASGGDMTKPSTHEPLDASSAAWPTRAPLLLKYRSKTDTDAVKAFTMTMPWANVRRVHALMEGGVGSALGSVPEVIDRLEHLYFGNLKKDLSGMALTGVQMDELEVDTQGKVKFYKSTMVHSVLQSFLDIFVVQQVAGPTEPMTTF